MTQMNRSSRPAFISRQVIEGQYYFLDLTPHPDVPMIVTCGGREECTTDYLIDRPGFQFYSIECVASGQGLLTISGNTFVIGPGSTFCYGPDIPHQIRNTSSPGMVKYFVSFVGKRALELLKASPLARFEPVQLADPISVIDIFEQLQYSGAMGTDFTQRICGLLLELLLLRVGEQSISTRQAQSRAWRTYRQCRQYIESRFLTLHSAQEAAKNCNLTSEYMCRLFRRFAKQTPYQLLLRLKMGRAAELLLHSDLLVSEVADAVGFVDPYHFSKVFKKVHGVSPRTFLIRIRRHRRPNRA